jgi:hypothetical protein
LLEGVQDGLERFTTLKIRESFRNLSAWRMPLAVTGFAFFQAGHIKRHVFSVANLARFSRRMNGAPQAPLEHDEHVLCHDSADVGYLEAVIIASWLHGDVSAAIDAEGRSVEGK